MTRKPTRADAVRAVVAAHPELRRKPARVAVLASRDGSTVSRQAAAAAMASSAVQGRPTLSRVLATHAADVEANHRRASSYPLRWSGTVLDTYPRCEAYIVPGDGVRVVAYDGVVVSHMTGDVETCARFCALLGLTPTKGGE